MLYSSYSYLHMYDNVNVTLISFISFLPTQQERASFRAKRIQKEVEHARKMVEQRVAGIVRQRQLRIERQHQEVQETEREVSQHVIRKKTPPPPPPVNRTNVMSCRCTWVWLTLRPNFPIHSTYGIATEMSTYPNLIWTGLTCIHRDLVQWY
jgi:hypothetical protein